jgi:hypothetical protein
VWLVGMNSADFDRRVVAQLACLMSVYLLPRTFDERFLTSYIPMSQLMYLLVDGTIGS